MILTTNGIFRSKSDKVYVRLQAITKITIDYTMSPVLHLNHDEVYAVSMSQLNYLLAQEIGWDRVNHEDWFGVEITFEENPFSTVYKGVVTYYPRITSIKEVEQDDPRVDNMTVSEDAHSLTRSDYEQYQADIDSRIEELSREMRDDPYMGEYNRR